MIQVIEWFPVSCHVKQLSLENMSDCMYLQTVILLNPIKPAFVNISHWFICSGLRRSRRWRPLKINWLWWQGLYPRWRKTKRRPPNKYRRWKQPWLDLYRTLGYLHISLYRRTDYSIFCYWLKVSFCLWFKFLFCYWFKFLVVFLFKLLSFYSFKFLVVLLIQILIPLMIQNLDFNTYASWYKKGHVD